ncbi:MAG: hypothetical protein J6K83_07165 [Bacteroidaceae bacterium]|nr:hypothetical protein [Bacteroidaceae bacterium]
MKTKYEIFIDAVSYAMEDHSYNVIWYYDFDEQDTVPIIEDTECYPEDGHRVLRIEPLPSRVLFCIMEDFANSLPESQEKERLLTSLRYRKPFSAFKHTLSYTSQRENWFAFKEKQMQEMIEEWMSDEGIVYKNGVFSCNGPGVIEYYKDSGLTQK